MAYSWHIQPKFKTNSTTQYRHWWKGKKWWKSLLLSYIRIKSSKNLYPKINTPAPNFQLPVKGGLSFVRSRIQQKRVTVPNRTVKHGSAETHNKGRRVPHRRNLLNWERYWLERNRTESKWKGSAWRVGAAKPSSNSATSEGNQELLNNTGKTRVKTNLYHNIDTILFSVFIWETCRFATLLVVILLERGLKSVRLMHCYASWNLQFLTVFY